MISRADYQASICGRLLKGEHVPFRQVALSDWHPKVGACHVNVDTWVKANPGTAAGRGWVTYALFGIAIGLTAHSVVLDTSNQLIDITPLGNEDTAHPCASSLMTEMRTCFLA